LRPFHYKGQQALGMDIRFDTALEREIRKLKGIKWRGQNNLWYLPISKELYETVKTFIADKALCRWPFLGLHKAKTYMPRFMYI
jgi:hypothetical protein